MAKSSKPSKPTPLTRGGPYLAAAVFCENAIQEKDNVFSVFRIIDRIIIYIPEDTPSDFPSEKNRIPINTNAFISFKTGYSPGNHKLQLTMISPSGKRNETLEHTMVMTKDANGGANLTIKIAMAVPAQGLFWMEVSLDDKPITMIPLLIDVERKNLATGQLLPPLPPLSQVVPAIPLPRAKSLTEKVKQSPSRSTAR